MSEAVIGADALLRPAQRRDETSLWPRRQRRGLSLFSTVLAAGFAGAVAVGLAATAVGVQTNIRASNTVQLVNSVEAKIRETYATLPQFEANLTDVALSAMPSNAVQTQSSTQVIVTPWGGLITAGGGATGGTGAASGDRFWIAIAGLPEAACETVAQAFLNKETVVGIEVLGDTTDAFSAMTSGTAIEAFDTAAEIVAECDGGSDDRVAVVFRS